MTSIEILLTTIVVVYLLNLIILVKNHNLHREPARIQNRLAHKHMDRLEEIERREDEAEMEAFHKQQAEARKKAEAAMRKAARAKPVRKLKVN